MKFLASTMFGAGAAIFLFYGYEQDYFWQLRGVRLYIMLFVIWGLPTILLAGIVWLVVAMPNSIIFDAHAKTVKINYLMRRRLAIPSVTPFSYWAAVQSYLVGGDPVNAKLVLRAANGLHLDLECKSAIYTGGGIFSPEYDEPKEISNLRLRVATLTGVKDVGFSPRYLDEFP
ncbi:MAG TPA: hypothetical protein VIY48_06370 [Candidatus Paceibacterota bacterium]